MGSRKAKKRRANPHTRVKVGQQKKRDKAPVPVVLPGTDQSTGWKDRTTLTKNYEALGLAADLTPAFGRNKPLREAEDDEEEEISDEENATLGKLAKTDEEVWRKAVGAPGEEPAPPRRLTSTQIRVVQALVEAHGDNLEAMFRDRKLNPMQHTVAARSPRPLRLSAPPGASIRPARTAPTSPAEFRQFLRGGIDPIVRGRRLALQVLRNMVKSYHAYPKLAAGGGGYRDFRAPKKSLGGRA